jgi:integrase
MMNEVGLNKNSIGKHIGTFKSIMASAASEGIHSNFIYMNKEFKILKESSDSVYLTRQELNAFKELNLSKYDQCYTIARDLFMIGVYTGQRVSDYTKITKKDITTTTDSEGKRIVYINIIQQKTSKRVSIPCIPQLIDILERYNYSLPQMRADKLNILIKEIARIAGINQLIEIKKDVSGIKKIEYLPKHQLIHSHTARRSFVTLSYMADIDTNDIMKITGHSDTKTLEIYNKSTIVNNESLLNNLHKIFCDI